MAVAHASGVPPAGSTNVVRVRTMWRAAIAAVNRWRLGLGRRPTPSAVLDSALDEMGRVGSQASPAAPAVAVRTGGVDRDSWDGMDEVALAMEAKRLERARQVDLASRLWLYLAQRRKYAPALVQLAAFGVDGYGVIRKDRAAARQLLERLVSIHVDHDTRAVREAAAAATSGSPTPPALAAWPSFILATLLLRLRVEAAAGRELPPSRIVLTDIPRGERHHPDCVAAFHLLSAVAATGRVPTAYFNLAHCYQAGVGCDPDPVAAERWLREGVRVGDPAACVELASTAAAAATPEQRASAAWQRSQHALWRTAALAGHPVAMHNVGVGYLAPTPPGQTAKGNVHPTLPPDADAALVWFQKAGNAGMVQSCINAGKLLLGGTPTRPPDPAAAVPWFSKAALILKATLADATALNLPPDTIAGYAAMLEQCNAEGHAARVAAATLGGVTTAQATAKVANPALLGTVVPAASLHASAHVGGPVANGTAPGSHGHAGDDAVAGADTTAPAPRHGGTGHLV